LQKFSIYDVPEHTYSYNLKNLIIRDYNPIKKTIGSFKAHRAGKLTDVRHTIRWYDLDYIIDDLHKRLNKNNKRIERYKSMWQQYIELLEQIRENKNG